MLTPFEWFALLCILAVALAGGWLPLSRPDIARRARGFPNGRAFAAGVFLALSLLIMLPASFALWQKAAPGLNFPVASLIAIGLFLVLLIMEQTVTGAGPERPEAVAARAPAAVPLIMLLMIAVPSFFLGAALGVSQESFAAWMIFIAIMAHKGTAGFALALQMARSSLSGARAKALYVVFACSTPVGILAGHDVAGALRGPQAVLAKAVVLALAAGTFLYMGALHELRHTPLIEECSRRRGFALMLAGFALTAGVRLVLGEAHHGP